jgi:hypothetical protein|tara:strand:+ start:117 stop:614 length:498 start_codon:yes stop_codon:yes gene_type:complete
VYGILSQLSKKMGRPAMRRVLSIIQKNPNFRPVKNIRNPNIADSSRLAVAQGMAEGSSRYLDSFPGTFMNYARQKVGNNPMRFRKVSDYFRARPDKRQQIDDWYKEMGSDSAWARGFLDDMIDEAERAPMSLEELAAAELSRVGKKPYSQSSVNRYLSNVAGKGE